MHSLIGAISIGTIISTLITVSLYPILTSKLFGLDKVVVKDICRLTPVLVLSCMLGNIFHILLDILTHPFNPILWPFVDPYDFIGILILVFGIEGKMNLGYIIVKILENIIMFLLIIAIIVKNKRHLWEYVLLGENININ